MLSLKPYTLKLAQAGNARSPKISRAGCLLFSDTGGVAAIQPWPELGDPSLDCLLSNLSKNDFSSGYLAQAKLCLQTTEIFSQSTSQKFPFLKDFLDSWEKSFPSPQPPHLLVFPDFNSSTFLPNLEELAQRHSILKFKLDGRKLPANLIAQLDKIHKIYPHLRWRIDFNATSNETEILKFAQLFNGNKFWEIIDFLEDPIPWNHSSYKRLYNSGIPLALDREAPALDQFIPCTRIIKPSLQNWRECPENQKLVFTHNMDHRVMRIFAKYEEFLYKKDRSENSERS